MSGRWSTCSPARPPERPAPMDRLLSPNEAKFCLMDWGAPMNTVIVTRTAAPVDVDALRNSGFRLPITVLDRNRRPRWAASDTVGVVEEEAATDWLAARSEEHTAELQCLMRHSYAASCSNKKKTT